MVDFIIAFNATVYSVIKLMISVNSLKGIGK